MTQRHRTQRHVSDKNMPAIIEAIVKCKIVYQDCHNLGHGFPDLILRLWHSEYSYLVPVEVKNPDTTYKFEPAEDIYFSLFYNQTAVILLPEEVAQLKDCFRIYGYIQSDLLRGDMDKVLSDRQVQFLTTMTTQELSYKQLAANFGVSIGTIKSTLYRAYRCLGVSNRADAIKTWRLKTLKHEAVKASTRASAIRTTLRSKVKH